MEKNKALKQIKLYLESLVFVNWDRYVDCWDTDGHFHFYGWIDRKDSYKDFLVFKVEKHQERNDIFIYSYITSSAEYSDTISQILKMKPDKHVKCQRIEKVYPTLQNLIKL